jgi:hypothetical protein
VCRKGTAARCFLACAADLAESTNVADFGKDFGAMKNFGWYERDKNLDGAIIPRNHRVRQLRDHGRAATTNLSSDPFNEFNGFCGVCSTYASFSYLKYGQMRILSQMAPELRNQSTARWCGLPGTPASRRRKMRARTTVCFRRPSRSYSRMARSSTCTRATSTKCRSCSLRP